MLYYLWETTSMSLVLILNKKGLLAYFLKAEIFLKQLVLKKNLEQMMLLALNHMLIAKT
jgi:hypothetical protein